MTCFILIIVYGSIFVMLFCLMRDIHSKHLYFKEHLQIEKEKLIRLKEKIFQFEKDVRNISHFGKNCLKYWHSFNEINFQSIYSFMEFNNKPIKKSYDETLYPLQRLVILLSYGNIYLMMTIYIKPFRLMFFSALLYVLTVCIYAEVFIFDKPNVYYTFTIAFSAFLFSILLLFQILIDLLRIVYYQSLIKTLRSN